RLDRKPCLEPGVAGHVEHLLAVLLDAAGHHVLDLARVDPGPIDHLAVTAPEQLVRVGVLVVALLLVPASDRRADGFDDDYLATILRHELLLFTDSDYARMPRWRLALGQLLLY